MRTNVGGADKIIRVAAGVAAIVLGIVFQSWWGLIGVILLGTGMCNFCPAYIPLKVSTKNDSK